MAEIEIVQADREAAADALRWFYKGNSCAGSLFLSQPNAKETLEHPIVQAFARHRLSAPTGDEYGRGLEDAAKVADDCIAQTGLDIGEVRQALSAEELSARGFIASTACKIAEQICALKGSLR